MLDQKTKQTFFKEIFIVLRVPTYVPVTKKVDREVGENVPSMYVGGLTRGR